VTLFPIIFILNLDKKRSESFFSPNYAYKVVFLFSEVFAKKMRNTLVLIERNAFRMSYEKEKRSNRPPRVRKAYWRAQESAWLVVYQGTIVPQSCLVPKDAHRKPCRNGQLCSMVVFENSQLCNFVHGRALKHGRASSYFLQYLSKFCSQFREFLFL